MKQISYRVFLAAFFVLAAFPVAVAAENCINCHAGSNPEAPDVYQYWDGSVWGIDGVQEGGHGDPDGRGARTCTEETGCHDVDSTQHENGILETAGNPSLNTSLLKAEFSSPSASPSSTVAEAFNTGCATLCHPFEGVRVCSGSQDFGGHDFMSGIPYTPQFGLPNSITPNDADGSGGARVTRLWLDSDISTRANKADPDFTLCVSCHDPHGTAIPAKQKSSNRMAREHFSVLAAVPVEDNLCMECHASLDTPPAAPLPASASDGTYPNFVRISWTDVAGENGYRIYRADDYPGPYRVYATTGPDQTTFDDYLLACDEVHFYRVSSYRDGLESALSSPDVGSTCSLATGSIAGTVTTSGGAGLGGVDVQVFSDTSTIARSSRSRANGTYAVYGLAPGTYRVMFRGEPVQFQSRWFDSTYGFDGAQPVIAHDSVTATGINGTLTARSDWNGDDEPDIFWRNLKSGANRLWQMEGKVLLQSVSLQPMTEEGWEAAAVADFDGDGKQDIFWRNYLNGRNLVWFTDGRQVLATGTVKRVRDTAWRIAAAGDVNGDGMVDLLWRNTVTGRNIFSLLNGLKLLRLLPAPQITDLAWEAGSMGDFNGDGHVDLFWRNTVTGENIIWIMSANSLTATAKLPRVSVLSWKMDQVGDFNSDGRADMIWRSYAAGANIFAFFNDGDLLGLTGIPKEKDLRWQIRQ